MNEERNENMFNLQFLNTWFEAILNLYLVGG